MNIDLNCDMGESFGSYHLGDDAAVMPWITSANIACGFHAGDPQVMDATVRMAVQHGVAIGAHPGYPDLQGFGRRNMELSPDEVETCVLYQVAALAGFTNAAGSELVHVKPHGALYNQAAKNRDLAAAVARGVARFSRQLILVGLAGSLSIEMAREIGLNTVNEAFPDRAYQEDGSLVPRRQPGAVLTDVEQVLQHALALVKDGVRNEVNGESRFIAIDSLCLHGDHPNAAKNARALREGLQAAGVVVTRPGSVL